jgi:hypothetical protein
MDWTWFTNRFFWVNLIAVLIAILDAIIGQNMWPLYKDDFLLAIAILDAISNGILGTKAVITVNQTKKQLAAAQEALLIAQGKKG